MEENKTVEMVEAKKEEKVSKVVSTEFKIIGIYDNDELVSIATSEASRLSKMVAIGDKEANEHELVEFVESEEVINEAYLSQTATISKLTKKVTKLELEIEKLEGVEKPTEKQTEKINKLEAELVESQEALETSTEINDLISNDSHDDKIYVLHSVETKSPFTTSKNVKNKKGVVRQKLSYYVYGDFKKANNGLRLRKANGVQIAVYVPIAE